jgi:hypothetical protein
MVKAIQRLKDENTSGGEIVETDGNTTVYANDRLVSVNTSLVGEFIEGDIQANDVTANGSNAVFVRLIGVNYTTNKDESGATRIGGSSDVFVGDDVDQDIPSIREVVTADDLDLDPEDPGAGRRRYEELVRNGTISKREQDVASPKPSGKKDTAPSKFTGTPTTACEGIELIVEPPGLPPLQGSVLDAVQLSPRFTVGKLTRAPNIIFDHPLKLGDLRLSLAETVCNLKLLAINVLEPIFSKYPNAFITNTFRPASTSQKSQHVTGQAVDLQFRNVTKGDYYIIAQDLKNLVPFDQFLLEYKTTGTRLPWIHISFSKSNNRKQVLTLLNDTTYGQGLIDLQAQ